MATGEPVMNEPAREQLLRSCFVMLQEVRVLEETQELDQQSNIAFAKRVIQHLENGGKFSNEWLRQNFK